MRKFSIHLLSPTSILITQTDMQLRELESQRQIQLEKLKLEQEKRKLEREERISVEQLETGRTNAEGKIRNGGKIQKEN